MYCAIIYILSNYICSVYLHKVDYDCLYPKFPSWYLAECGFSAVNDLLLKKRNQLDINKWGGDLRLMLTKLVPNYSVASTRISLTLVYLPLGGLKLYFAFDRYLYFIVIKIVAKRKNSKLLFSVGIILPLEFRINIFRPMRMNNAILPGWPPQTI